MKKKIIIFLIIVLILILVIGGYLFINWSKNIDNNETTNTIIENEEIEEEIEEYVDDNPINVGLYVDRVLIDTYEDNFVVDTDIVSLECYFTNDSSVDTGNFKDVWYQYYNTYEDIDNYRIGYYISFSTDTEEYSKYIYRPDDVWSVFEYVQLYLYDDIHQDASWYSHVSEEEYTDETMFTSIKLTASTSIGDIVGDIKIMVFTYDSDDINENNEYIGNSYYTVLIRSK